jgi:hypothetical protein
VGLCKNTFNLTPKNVKIRTPLGELWSLGPFNRGSIPLRKQVWILVLEYTRVGKGKLGQLVLVGWQTCRVESKEVGWTEWSEQISALALANSVNYQTTCGKQSSEMLLNNL